MRVSAKRKKLLLVEESAVGMGGLSGRDILSPSFSPHPYRSSYSVNRELARIQSKLLGQTLGHLIPDKGRRLPRPAVAPATAWKNFPSFPSLISVYALPVCSGTCGGRWTIPSDSKIRDEWRPWVDLFSQSIVRGFFFEFRGTQVSRRSVLFYSRSFFFIGDLRNRWNREEDNYSIILSLKLNFCYGLWKISKLLDG